MSDVPIVACADCLAPVIEAVDQDGELIRIDALPVPGGKVALEIDANKVVLAHLGGMAQTFGQTGNDLRVVHKTTCGTWPPRVPKHQFALDERIAPDYAGRRWCICGVPGVAGDARHPIEASPLRPPTDQAVIEEAARERDAAILGERADVDDDTLLGLLQVTATQLDLSPRDLADRVVARVTADLRRRNTAS